MPDVVFCWAAETFVLALEEGAADAVTKPEEVLEAGPVAPAAEVVPAAAAEVVPAAAAVEPVEEEERYEGAATAVEGSTSAPVPHGMASPLGCVELAGSVVLPFASAIAKRVVQSTEDDAGVVNW